MASYYGVDIEGLDGDDIDEINRFVEFIRNMKKKCKFSITWNVVEGRISKIFE